MLGLVGVTARDLSVAAVTVRGVEPEIAPDVAEMVAEPADTAVTEPVEPAVLLTVATAALDELHVTEAVRSCVVLSEKVPVATNCCTVPLATLELTGVIAMDTSVAAVTVSVVDPEIFPFVAVMVV